MSFISELSVISFESLKLAVFKHILIFEDKSIANKFAYNLSKKLQNSQVHWKDNTFWLITKINEKVVTLSELNQKILEIKEEREELSAYPLQLTDSKEQATPEILAELAATIVRNGMYLIDNKVIVKQLNARVEREPRAWAETIKINGTLEPAIAITFSSPIAGSRLEQVYNQFRLVGKKAEDLINLPVKTIDMKKSCKIVAITGQVKQRRSFLLKKATGWASKAALTNAPDDQPIVAVQFGKSPNRYEYALGALCIRPTPNMEKILGFKYEELKKHTKVSYSDRLQLMEQYKLQSIEDLKPYGFKLTTYISSKRFSDLFQLPKQPLKEVKFLFGNGLTSSKSQTKSALQNPKGGVYYRNPEFDNRKSRIACLKLFEAPVMEFVTKSQKWLQQCKFENEVVYKERLNLPLELLTSQDEVGFERAMEKVLNTKPDLVFAFLSDCDNQLIEDENSNNIAILNHI